MEELEQTLAVITVKVSEATTVETKDLQNVVPESYKSNNKKEKLLLSFAKNFQRQFRQLYGDRKPLFLTPHNECGIEKFICSTLRATQLPYKELYNYDGCASFVADYLNYESLKVPNELPDKLHSSTSVLKEQKGNSFDYSVLLTSLLLGGGYDAYCVCGYATREVALLDQSRKKCPLLQQKENELQKEASCKKPKYSVRPAKDLTSKFLKRQEQKEKDKIASEGEKKREEEEARLAELEKPPPDKYHGLRYHCWVLVLAGKREIGQSFFIEPTTGETNPLDFDQYLGIETLWNHRNFWVNMQDCSQGISTLVYDLGDATKWEFFFPDVEKPLLVVPGEEMAIEEEDEDEKEEEDIKDHFELPPSWVEAITISERDFETRCPKGCKTVLYYRSMVEKFAPYLNQDGLVMRLTVFQDTARTDKVQIKEEFVHREDCLLSRETNTKSREIVECFGRGRDGSLKDHTHYGTKGFKADCHSMSFYSNARVDGLAKRDITSIQMTEHFEGRPDRLYYREVWYGKPVKRFEPAEKERAKHIQKIIEKFHHNPKLPPNSDIAQCIFLLDENKIQLTYHLEENRVTASTREFFLPVLSGEQTQPLTMNPDMTSAYQVDSYSKEPKQRVLFEFVESLLSDQENSIAMIRSSEKEIEKILSTRLQEEMNTVLNISVYDVQRNETARLHRQELERKQAEEERIRREKEKDYLAPFLARFGDPLVLKRKEKEQVKEICLQDLRTRLVEMANIIQSHFEKETEELQKKQTWYKQKQSSITRDEETEYVSYCSDAMFRIHILEQRLNRHKTTAPQKYINLERRLNTDQRLVIHDDTQ